MFKTNTQFALGLKFKKPDLILLLMLAILSVACTPKELQKPSTGHLGLESEVTTQAEDIPPPVVRAPVLPPPEAQEPLETYTVIVNDVPAKELLFALARDAKLNLDIYDDIEGMVTINAIDQTMPQILSRIAKQTNIRYQMDGGNLAISADTPYLRTYKVPYVNISRDAVGQIDSSTQIASSGTVGVGDRSSGSSGPNNSTISVVNTSVHDFWKTLYANISAIIGEGATGKASGNVLTSNSVMVNRESGLVTVRANSKQHADIQKFIDLVLASVQRQVLIEATVVEVSLSDTYQAGVDWARLTSVMLDGIDGINIDQSLLSSNLQSAPALVLDYADQDSDGTTIAASVRLLQQFGDVRVLSSPKIMALNNQTSILKVVDNRVYFTIEAETTDRDTYSRTTYETQIHTVPVGLVMSLVPYISDSDQVTLNIRPTISRILKFVNDPNPALQAAGVISSVPEIQVREMESVLRLNNGQIAVIGGLMQDSRNKMTDGVPGISRVPILGEAFKYRNNQIQKTELVIFLRATVIREPSLKGDLKQFQQFLPSHQASGS